MLHHCFLYYLININKQGVMTQASSHLVIKLAYIFFLRKFKVISKTISINFHIHQIPHTKIAYQVSNS